jgi:hypothetical protein
MGYVHAKTLAQAKLKVAKEVRKHNQTNNIKRAIDYVEATNKEGVYAYATRERR